MEYPETVYVKQDCMEVDGHLTKENAYYSCNCEIEKLVPLNNEYITIGVYKLVETKKVKAEIVINE